MNGGVPSSAAKSGPLQAFQPIFLAVEQFLYEVGFSGMFSGDERIAFELKIKELAEELADSMDRLLIVGIPKCKTEYPGGVLGWEFDVKKVLKLIKNAMERVKDASTAFPNENAAQNFSGEIDGKIALKIAEFRDSAHGTLNQYREKLEDRVGELRLLENEIEPPVPPTHVFSVTETDSEGNSEVQHAGKSAASKSRVEKAILNRTEEAVLKILRGLPKGKGMKGSNILKALSKDGIEIELTTLTRHVIPKLKEHFNVKSHRAAGGYLVEKS